MMRSLLVFASLLVSLAGSITRGEIDRPAEHARSLNGLDLTRRADAPGMTPAPFLSTADGPDIRFSQVTSPARFSQDPAEDSSPHEKYPHC